MGRVEEIYLIQTLSPHAASISALSMDGMEELVVVGCTSGHIKLWDLQYAKGIECVGVDPILID